MLCYLFLNDNIMKFELARTEEERYFPQPWHPYHRIEPDLGEEPLLGATREIRFREFKVRSASHQEGGRDNVTESLLVHICGAMIWLIVLGPVFKKKKLEVKLLGHRRVQSNSSTYF